MSNSRRWGAPSRFGWPELDPRVPTKTPRLLSGRQFRGGHGYPPRRRLGWCGGFFPGSYPVDVEGTGSGLAMVIETATFVARECVSPRENGATAADSYGEHGGGG